MTVRPLAQAEGNRWDADCAIILDETKRRVVRNIRAEVEIEPAGRGAVGNQPGEIDVTQTVRPIGGRFSVLRRPLPAQVPFADAACCIALLFQKRGDGQPIGL